MILLRIGHDEQFGRSTEKPASFSCRETLNSVSCHDCLDVALWGPNSNKLAGLGRRGGRDAAGATRLYYLAATLPAKPHLVFKSSLRRILHI